MPKRYNLPPLAFFQGFEAATLAEPCTGQRRPSDGFRRAA